MRESLHLNNHFRRKLFQLQKLGMRSFSGRSFLRVEFLSACGGPAIIFAGDHFSGKKVSACGGPAIIFAGDHFSGKVLYGPSRGAKTMNLCNNLTPDFRNKKLKLMK